MLNFNFLKFVEKIYNKRDTDIENLNKQERLIFQKKSDEMVGC